MKKVTLLWKKWKAFGQKIADFQVTVHGVEQLVGLEFLWKLRDTKEEAVKSTKPAVWEYDLGAWNKRMKEKCG